MKRLACLITALMMVFWLGSALAAEYTGPEVKAKFASEEIEGDFMTVWGKNFAQHMKDWSGGKIDIAVYPYGTLGDSRDINELAQLGVVDFVYTDYAWISSFVPQVQVLTLNYLWPRERVAEVMEWVVKNGKLMPLLEQKFRANGLVPLAIVYEGWQWMSSKKPIESMADVKGLKLRLMASKLLVESYKSYGAAPTPMSYGEVYSGLQTGLIDAQVNPLFAIYSMKFFEVQDYVTQLWSEPFLGIPTANQKFFDSLSKDAQAEMRKFWMDAIPESAKWIDKVNDECQAKMAKERPQVKFHVLPDDKIAEFKAAAEKVYPEYVKIGGEGAGDVLETLRQDIAEAKKALGVK